MQPADPIIVIDARSRLGLHLFGLHLTVDPSLMWWGIFLAFGTTSFCIGLYRGRYPLSNKRATLGSCPPSSVSTAETSPAPDHGVWIALKSGVCAATPGPRETPHPEDLEKHTVRAQKRYWRQHGHAPSAGARRRTVIHSRPTTSFLGLSAAETPHCGPSTAHATAEQEGSSPAGAPEVADTPTRASTGEQASDLGFLF